MIYFDRSFLYNVLRWDAWMRFLLEPSSWYVLVGIASMYVASKVKEVLPFLAPKQTHANASRRV